MARHRDHGPVPGGPRRAKRDGELSAAPAGLTYVWVLLVVLLVLETAHELFGIGGHPFIYETWFHDVVIAAAAVLMLARAVHEPTTRGAWLAFGLAMASWSVGTIAWSLAYSGHAHVPYPSFAGGPGRRMRPVRCRS